MQSKSNPLLVKTIVHARYMQSRWRLKKWGKSIRENKCGVPFSNHIIAPYN